MEEIALENLPGGKWYLLILTLLALCFMPWLAEHNRVSSAENALRAELAPKLTLSEFDRELDSLMDEQNRFINGEIPEDPKVFWNYRKRIHRLNFVAQNLRSYGKAEHVDLFKIVRLEGKFSIFSNGEGLVTQAILAKLGPRVPGQSPNRSRAYFDMPPDERPEPWENVSVYGRRGELFSLGYLYSIPLMLACFCLRLARRRLMIYPELWRLLPAAVFWPLAIFVYPMNVERKEQLKTAMQVISLSTSAMMSLIGSFGLGLVQMAKAQVNAKTENTVGKKRSSYGWGTEAYPYGIGIDRGFLFSPFYSHSHDLGRGLTWRGSGFIEMGQRPNMLFTNHGNNLSYRRLPGPAFSLETGADPNGLFLQVGSKVDMTEVPGLKPVTNQFFVSVVVGQMWRIRGPTRFREWFVSWASKEVALPRGLRLNTEGFMRLPAGPKPAVGQPQILLRHKNRRNLQFLVEFWMIGQDPTVRAGVQFAK